MAEPVKRRRRRLDFLIARLTGMTRKQAKQCIRAGRVRVEGMDDSQLKGQARVGIEDAVYLDDELLERESGDRYIMLNKPAGVVSATRDDYDPTVLGLMDPEERRGLHPVGRLDKDTTGLLLLTTDGEWSHRITSPRHACPKVYRVDVAEPLDDETLERLETGIVLRGDNKASYAQHIERISETRILMTLNQGRYHQIKRMIGAVGNRVTGLHRERVGGLVLDDALSEGDYRSLTLDEINSVMPLQDPQEQ
ncbi:ribosomal small subunit pseudouridine synthase A [Halospina denitrificans]|uniref:Pseudouridine synthase n=1 Tax=Halospina denitrificans TaxID=332522 RepID=A0A4R7JIR7_9GAMM|nr:pseudouridine synthase [Halospina denitrificans]TDT37800.1 ribosomal small subunit pseudouridine synthase A [Halospina denitrificans]